MDNSVDAEFVGKLLIVLKKITESDGVDNSYLEKLLSNLRFECDDDDYFKTPELAIWLSETINLWKSQCPSAPVTIFIWQFIGILCRNEDVFKLINTTSALDDLSVVSFPLMQNNTSVKVAFLRFLNDVANHKSGCGWVVATKHWKTVIKWYLLNTNFYIAQEGLILIKKLIAQVGAKHDVVEEIFQDVVLPLGDVIYKKEANENMFNIIKPSFKLLEGILKTSNGDKICLKLSEVFDIEKMVKYFLEKCHHEKILESASSLYILNILLKFDSKLEFLSMNHIPSEILQLFVLLLEKNHINCIMRLSKFCQLFWSEMRNELKCESPTVIHFIIFQLIPVLCYKHPPESKIFDSLLQKLFNLTSQSTQKFAYSLRDKIRRTAEVKNWALKSLSSVASHTDCLTHNEAVLIFQCLAYALHFFVPEKNCDQELTQYEGKKTSVQELCDDDDVPLLSAVLNSLCMLVEKFKINWAESLESLCLVKMACQLLENSNLSCILVVQTLLLVKLAIINYMSVDLAFLLNVMENSSLKCLLPLLYKHMHNRNWEIRDSCIEVVTTITELAEHKYPAFQYLLLERDFCRLVYGIMEGDSESYVRASSLRCLSAMMKIESLRNSMNTLELPRKIIHLMNVESEGIVRREAVLLVKQIYLNCDLKADMYFSFYEIMGFAAICDLHWEVKVNSLLFWEAVIQKIFADQGMIDGSFPKVTFSKEHKKIVTLTNDEIKLRLTKILTELSRVGCLHVLLSALDDECDFQVVKKSVEIMTDLLNILKRYQVIIPNDCQPSNRMSLKRKHADFQDPEVRKSLCKTTVIGDVSLWATQNVAHEKLLTNDSDTIIEEIVNEMDINLLVSVHETKQKETIMKKRIILQAIKPEIFVMQMKDFECEKFLEDKKKWLTNSYDLRSLVNDIIMVNSRCETNVMDCY